MINIRAQILSLIVAHNSCFENLYGLPESEADDPILS